MILSICWASRADRLRLLNRYDAEQLDKDLFDYCTKTVFSEPQLDDLREEIPTDGAAVFAVEYLPGQFDQRAIPQRNVFRLFPSRKDL